MSRSVAFAKECDFLADGVFGDLEVGRLQSGDIVSFAVGDGNIELDQINRNLELRLLRIGPSSGTVDKRKDNY